MVSVGEGVGGGGDGEVWEEGEIVRVWEEGMVRVWEEGMVRVWERRW